MNGLTSNTQIQNKVSLSCPQCGKTMVLGAEEAAESKNHRCPRCWAYMIKG